MWRKGRLMYGGHFGFALAARAADRDLSLAVAVPAAFAPDLLRLGWTAVGTSAAAPDGFVGSAATSVFLAVLVGAAWGWRRRSVGAGIILGLVVVSHSVGDLMEGAIRLWPGGPTAGLELTDVPLANHGLQLAIIGIGWYLYRRSLAEPPADSREGAERSSSASWAAPGVLLVVLGFHLAAAVVRVFAS